MPVCTHHSAWHMGRAWQISLFRAGHSFLISELVGGRILKLLLQGSHPLVIESNMNLGTVFGDVIKATTQLTVHREMNLDYQGGYNVIT